MKTRVTELLGIETPIIQGGMAWVAESHLAAAVSAAGGFGILGSATAPADVVRNWIKEIKETTDKPFGVNIMLMSPYAEEVAHLAAEEKVAAVTTGAGNPGKFVKLWKDAGVKVMPVVASVAMAKLMERAGADAIIAEGCEAGGHIGEITTMALLPQVVDAVSVPVIGAGVVGDGRGVAAAFMLGAEGVQIGTRFVVADESIVHDNYKERIIGCKDIDSAVTGRSTGHPVRSIRNRLTKEYAQLEASGASAEEIEQFAAGALRKAVVEGDVVYGSVMAGQIAGLIKKRQSCKEIITELMAEAELLFKNAPDRI
jgi:enoyl-[acyl-carrier protein] reductase II